MKNPEELHTETRQLLFWTLTYHWFSYKSFKQSKYKITLLKTLEVIPKKDYFFKNIDCCYTIDLSKNIDDLFVGFLKDTRTSVRKAEKNNIIVKKATTQKEFNDYYEYFTHFANSEDRKDKILKFKREEIDKLDIFYTIAPNGEYLGGLAFFGASDKSIYYYKYGATSHKYSESYLIMWEAMKYARSKGYKIFSTSAFIIPNKKNSKEYSLYSFKRKFGGNLVSFYTYIDVKFPLNILGVFFSLFMKIFFKNNLSNFALFMKKIKIFN